jgi:hypothetical protein
VDQNLVDHDLENHGRREGEELQRQRGRQHVAQHPAVLDESRNEPGDVEPGLRRNRQARRDQNGPATCSNSDSVTAVGAAPGRCIRTCPSRIAPMMK